MKQFFIYLFCFLVLPIISFSQVETIREYPNEVDYYKFNREAAHIVLDVMTRIGDLEFRSLTLDTLRIEHFKILKKYDLLVSINDSLRVVQQDMFTLKDLNNKDYKLINKDQWAKLQTLEQAYKDQRLRTFLTFFIGAAIATSITVTITNNK